MDTHHKATLALSFATLLSPMMQAADLNRDHVLLISIDGMHAVDFENCVTANTYPNLASLGRDGVNYTRTSLRFIPRLMALVTGGTPNSVSVFYEIA